MSTSKEKCFESLLEALQMQKFENCQNETLFEKLSVMTDEELRQRLQNQSHRTAIPRKEFNIEKNKRIQLKKRTEKTLGQYHGFHLGQGTAFSNIVDVLDLLTERDYPDLANFDGSQSVQIFIPEVFLTNCPKIIGEQEYLNLKKSQGIYDKYEGHYDSFKGEDVERLCFESVSSYFTKKDDSYVIIHRLPLQPLNKLGSHKEESKEKDFVIVNYTHAYFMVIEVKRSLYCQCDKDGESSNAHCYVQKGAEQLKSAHFDLQNWFGGDIDDFWWYIPVTFCLETNLSKPSDSMIIGHDQFEIKFDRLIRQMYERRTSLKSPMKCKEDVFKLVAKFMIFCASNTELPVNRSIVMKKIKRLWREAGSYENVKLWAFWNPAQQKIIGADLNNVILSSAYSTGKTTLLTGRANILSKY